MEKTRIIQSISKSTPTLEGAGVQLKRVFGHGQAPRFDPFLMMDDFRADSPEQYIKGFPWHPHRGIETITYVLKGSVEHGDSLGNEGVITPGSVQWMTAGSGIIHQEMPKGDAAGKMGGFQLWANLPAVNKMMAPRYRDVPGNDIPAVRLENGAEIRVISGTVADQSGPVKDVVIEPTYLDVKIPAGTEFTHPTPSAHTVLAYVIFGQAYFDPRSTDLYGNETLISFDSGDCIHVRTAVSPVRFLLLAGKPIGEPVAWQGPIVMNTKEELELAFSEYRKGTFIKHPSPDS